MQKEMIREQQFSKKNFPATYYFTVLFIVIGTFVALYMLHRTLDQINIFIILLAIAAGGFPIGFIGTFIDYLLTKRRVKQQQQQH